MPLGPTPDEQTISKLLQFLSAAGDLKDTFRSGFTNAGHQESTAEHSWRLALLVIALEPYLQGLDMTRLLKLAILHDLGEAVTGDVPAIDQNGDQTMRQEDEWQAVQTLTEDLPRLVGQNLQTIVSDYMSAGSAEAQIVKGLDKLETIHQHATAINPRDFDYAFNLTYGAEWTATHPLVAALRASIDALTRQRLADQPQR